MTAISLAEWAQQTCILPIFIIFNQKIPLGISRSSLVKALPHSGRDDIVAARNAFEILNSWAQRNTLCSMLFILKVALEARRETVAKL